MSKAGTDPTTISNLFLTGFMGAGKSTVGRLLAQKLNRGFCDLDESVEKSTGKAISDLFRENGEVAFRELEANALGDVTNRSNQIIALGGGALLSSRNLDLVRNRGTLIYLKASLKTLEARLKSGKAKRPLLVNGAIAELFEARKKGYETASITIETDGKAPSEITQELLSVLGVCE